MIEQIQRISTKAIIRKDGKILFVCEPNGKWELPGGKPDFGEHMEETIKRELSEELGLKDIKINGVFGQLDFISHVPSHNADYQFVIIVFSVEADTSNITLSHEHTEFAWYAPEELQELNIKHEYKEFFKRSL